MPRKIKYVAVLNRGQYSWVKHDTVYEFVTTKKQPMEVYQFTSLKKAKDHLRYIASPYSSGRFLTEFKTSNPTVWTLVQPKDYVPVYESAYIVTLDVALGVKFIAKHLT
jgi:hypothetical protein